MPEAGRSLRVGHRFGKYRILRRIAETEIAQVYHARDTVQEIDVALKVPIHDGEMLQWFREEARLHARLEHPNILPIKNADWIEGRFLIVSPLAERSLEARLRSRISVLTFLDYAQQMLAAVACAHTEQIIHCDLKPANFLLFADGTVKLADFGISKLSPRTVRSSGSGTIGYIAPEQAMGRASFRSDVFSLGLIFWQMLTGKLPEWPFEWPLPGHERGRSKVPAQFLGFLRKSLEVNPRKRYPDAGQMWAVFERLVPRVKHGNSVRRTRRRGRSAPRTRWKQVRFREFVREFRSALRLDRECERCSGPMSESMSGCPWCGRKPAFARNPVSFPSRCRRCKRGRKLDWQYCAWCYGPGFRDVADQPYSDRRYESTCSHRGCRGPLMPFMRYCPSCRRKVTRRWPLAGSSARCTSCGWGVAKGYWETCPWCVRPLR